MEEICSALGALLIEAGTGGYKIYYEEELLEALPEGVRNRETLEAALKNLSEGRYIDVKYARGNAFCISALKKFVPTPPAEPEGEAVCECAQAPVIRFPTKKLYIYTAVSALLGGAAGGCIAAVLGAVL